jgi:hypothetical protein
LLGSQKFYFIGGNSFPHPILHPLIDDYQLDGVYLDGTGIPVAACHNVHHGCQKADGTPGGTYPIFAGRALLRRI